MSKKYRIVRNIYPAMTNVPHAEPGDIVSWQPQRNKTRALIRESDGKTVLSLGRLSPDALKEFPESGIIAQVKSKGWVLEIEEVKE